MTGRTFKKLMVIVLAICVLATSACGYSDVQRIEQVVNESMEKAERNSMVHSIEKKTFAMYCTDLSDENKEEIELCFMDGVTDIPYITVDTMRNIMIESANPNEHPNYDLTVKKDGNTVTLSRETNYNMTINCDEDTIHFWDYDAFLNMSNNNSLIDIVNYTGFNEEGEAELFQISDASFVRYGEDVTFRPGDYGIDLIAQDGEYYIPLKVYDDIILSNSGINTLYNGKAVFLIAGGNVDAVADEYFIEDAPKERSPELIDFNYKELCFAMDAMYGLKETHDITDFDTLFMKADLKNQLLSKDPQEAGQALADLTLTYFDDRHSGFLGRSYMMEEAVEAKIGPGLRQMLVDKARYQKAREEAYPDGIPPYEESGNTAYITFDSFRSDHGGLDYYKEDLSEHLDDTIALMLYSYSQITREGSPVENVVLDLSNNGGGESPAAAFVIGTFIGDGSVCLTDTLTGALVSEVFKVDLNLDRKFDEKDSLLDYNLFCLTNGNSFSCGNLVPSALHNSHMVTTLGQTSGGGSCVVRFMTTADGCPFQMSGNSRLAYMKNGAFYNIDQGVEPDFILPSPKQFYDREYLTGYINGLLGNNEAGKIALN